MQETMYFIFLSFLFFFATGVFRGKTYYSATADQLEGCSFISEENAGGVMCCKDDGTTPTLPPTMPPVPGSCNFESGMCGWIVDKTAPLRFIKGQGETVSRNTGPRYDHTKKDEKGKVTYIKYH